MVQDGRMNHIRIALGCAVAALVALWLAADPPGAPGFLAWRAWIINGSGVVAIGTMSLALLLALRPVRFEPWFGGLDKMYRLHKWLGVTALVASSLHWLATQAPKWAVAAGWMQGTGRLQHAQPEAGVAQLMADQRGLAEGLGEWAFYGAVLLIVLALLQRFPYRWFFKTHRMLTLAFGVLVFHVLVLMPLSWWGGFTAPLIAVLMMAGVLASLRVLLGRVGRGRRAVGVVESVNPHAGLDVLEVQVQFRDGWHGHHAGQFAFVSFDRSEGPHPFTIASAWVGDGRLLFVIKALGDHTRALLEGLQPGGLVTVEGPYGQFNFNGSRSRQVWVGAGVGITPFIARMQQLAQTPDGRIVDLFHTTAVFEAAAISQLRRDAAAAQVRLHVLVDAQDGLLDAERICREVPDWRDGDVWFCGPAAFGRAMRRDFAALGLVPAEFHQELFSLR
jgi:predicted ferric reductase